jgi:hypothetical protein
MIMPASTRVVPRGSSQREGVAAKCPADGKADRHQLPPARVAGLPRPFLPFLPALDKVPPAIGFQRGLRVTYLIAGMMLLLNRWVRVSCLVCAAVLFLGALSSRLTFANNRQYAGCLLFLAALTRPGQSPWLIRYQVVLLYFGAGLNKILDVDWRSGQFFEIWAHGAKLVRVRLLFPPRVFSLIASWWTILIEFVAAVAGRPSGPCPGPRRP